MNTPMMNFIHTPYGYCYYDLDKPVSDGGTYLIFGLFVYPEYRRNGHSKRMLQFLIDEIRGTGYSGPIYVKAKPEGNSIKVDTLSMYYRQMGLTVLTEVATDLQQICNEGELEAQDALRREQDEKGGDSE